MSDIHPTQHPLDGKLEPETKDCFGARAAKGDHISIRTRRLAGSWYPRSAAEIIRQEGWRLGDKAGELLTMGDGSRWFHPWSGGAPTQLTPPRDA